MKDIISIKGIKLRMEKDKGKTPFVYASFGSYNALFSIRTGKRISGEMPQEQADQIETWIVLNDEKLKKDWNDLS